MKTNIIGIIALLISSPFLLFIVHIISIKIIKSIKIEISMQKVVVYCLLFINIPVIIIYIIVNRGFNIIDTLYVLLVYNSFAYFYFHFFNMSETARRIKILIGIKNKKINSVDDLSTVYHFDKSLEIRLKRLIQLNQLEKNTEGYILKKKLLFRVSYLIWFFRILLGFENKY